MLQKQRYTDCYHAIFKYHLNIFT